MDVDRESLFCQWHSNLFITFLCPIKTIKRDSTMWVSFVIWIFTAIEWKGN